MTRKLFVVALLAALLAATAAAFAVVRGVRQKSAAHKPPAGDAGVKPTGPKSARGRVPVVVELFTSEGCSSCPPADEVLSRLDETQPVDGAEVIALSQHVDYWNYLGWSDPFSSHEFSERQGAYASAFGKDGVYTPQMIVDGRAEFAGGNGDRAVEAIEAAAREPKAEVTIARQESLLGEPDTLRLKVRVANQPKTSDGGAADLLLFITEGGLSSDVERGENTGRKLKHSSVVRRMSSIGGSSEGTYETETSAALDKGWRRENMRAVVVLQERASKRVLGAASLKL